MIQEFLKGKTIEEIKDNLKGLSNNELIKKCIEYQTYELLPRDENGICIYLGSLFCSDTNLKKLPNNLTIYGNLDCTDNNLNKLPDNLTVNGSLNCSENNLTSLPDNLTVNGSLYCSHNNLTSLPENLIVNGNLNCSENNLTSLPDNLIVNDSLYCRKQKSGIKLTLPKSAVIKGKFIN